MAVKKPRAYWPLTIGSTNNAFEVRESGGGAYTSKTLTSGTYVTPEALADDLVARINEVLGTPDVSRSIDATTGKLTLTRTSGDWDINFSVSNSCGDAVGFEDSNNLNSTEYTGTIQMANAWWSPTSVEFDDVAAFHREAGWSQALSGPVQITKWGQTKQRRIGLAYLDPNKVFKSRENTENEALQRLWEDGYAKFRWWPSATATGTFEDLVLDRGSAADFRPRRQFRTKELYSIVLECWEYVA